MRNMKRVKGKIRNVKKGEEKDVERKREKGDDVE